MKKIIFTILSVLLIVSCKRNNQPISTATNSDAKEYSTEDMIAADKEYEDSVDFSGYNPDEQGICEGLPRKYDSKNDAEKNLSSSLKNYWKAAVAGDIATAKSYISPKVFTTLKEEFPEYSQSEIDKIFSENLLKFTKIDDLGKKHFEGYEKTVPVISNLYKLPSKEGSIIYSVHFSITILCTTDKKNYYVWHMPTFLFAASPNNGEKWYFIELVEGYKNILADYK